MTFRKFLYLISVLLCFIISCEDKKGPSFEITFDPTEQLFGQIEINQIVSQRIQIKNTNNSSEAFVGKIKIMDSPNFRMDFSGVLTLQKNESKEIFVTFQPSTAQEYNAKLAVTNDNDDYFEMYLRGEGVAPVSFLFDKIKLEFGLVQPGDIKDLDVSFSNNATSGNNLELTLSIPSSDFSILGGVNILTIPPGQSEIITVRYLPTINTSTKSLKITHNSSVRTNPADIILTGLMDITASINTSINNGWTKFEDGNYNESVTMFFDAMNKARVNSVYDSIYDEAMHGLGWSELFNRSKNDYAFVANNYFLKAANNQLFSMSSYYDALAGFAISGVLTFEKTNIQYILSAANTVLNDYPNYQFSHKKSINYKHVRMALIQAYYYLGKYNESASEMNILDPANSPHSTDPIELLTAIQNLAGSL